MTNLLNKINVTFEYLTINKTNCDRYTKQYDSKTKTCFVYDSFKKKRTQEINLIEALTQEQEQQQEENKENFYKLPQIVTVTYTQKNGATIYSKSETLKHIEQLNKLN